MAGLAGEPRAPDRAGLLRGLGWLGASAWWCAKSPTGGKAMLGAALPWAVFSFASLPTGGLAVVLGMAFYAQLSLWSTLCARAHFRGEEFDFKALRGQWGEMFSKARGLALAFLACAAFALAWVKLCVDLSAIAELLEALRSSHGPSEARALVMAAWSKEGWDGIAWPLAVMQVGLAAVNAVWLTLPRMALEHPERGPLALLGAGLRAARASPLALGVLGLVGALLAQAGLVFPPVAMFSGLWFLACAFAWRDVWGAARLEAQTAP